MSNVRSKIDAATGELIITVDLQSFIEKMIQADLVEFVGAPNNDDTRAKLAEKLTRKYFGPTVLIKNQLPHAVELADDEKLLSFEDVEQAFKARGYVDFRITYENKKYMWYAKQPHRSEDRPEIQYVGVGSTEAKAYLRAAQFLCHVRSLRKNYGLPT